MIRRNFLGALIAAPLLSQAAVGKEVGVIAKYTVQMVDLTGKANFAYVARKISQHSKRFNEKAYTALKLSTDKYINSDSLKFLTQLWPGYKTSDHTYVTQYKIGAYLYIVYSRKTLLENME